CRRYPEEGFLHSIGFLTRKDNIFLSTGASGLEALYDEILKGTPGKIIEEINAKDELVGSGFLVESRPGTGLMTSLDYGLQLKLSQSIKSTAETYGFKGGAGVVVNPKTGEVLALSSIPEFDPNILIENPKKEIVNALVNDPKKPFFNRAVSGLYPPGSIVKPAVAAAALAEGIIDSKKEILSSTPIVIKNPFSPDKPDIFPDWKQHGWVDMKKALAISSDIYFYTVGGGHESQKGLGVWNIEKYFREFGFGKKTGIDLPGEKDGFLPDPEKETGDGRRWGIGDTYHLAIGQGDLQVTPVQMAFYASLLAGSGEAMYPHLVESILNKDNNIAEKFSYSSHKVDGVSKEIFDEVREGMRDAVKYGTAVGLSGYGLDIAAKTGTAEIGNTGRVHSWSIGFLPYDNPKIAWAIVMENGPVANTVGATFVASQMLQWMIANNFLQSL
ncbi:MAG: penicillin-binding transpeptidase domain-containing protein, partial [Patescibacteria group bacterium]